MANKRDPLSKWLYAWLVLVLLFLFVPIIVVIIYSFNDGRNLMIWNGASTFWYGAVFENHRILSAMDISIRAALINVVFSVVLGTMAGLVVARHKGFWTAPFMFLLFLALITPELVSAIGQVIWYNQIGMSNGLARLSIGHSLFNVALVTLVVKGRAEGMSDSLEKAAGDLGAPPWKAFLQITLPVMMPAVIAGALLSFTYSFDDVIISLFVQQPGFSTLPVYILSSLKAGLRGDVAAVVVMALAVTVVLLPIASLLLRRGSSKQKFIKTKINTKLTESND